MKQPKFPDTLPAGVDFPDMLHPGPGLSRACRGIEGSAHPEPVEGPDPDEPAIDFTPVPRARARRNGWSEDRQRAFIAALAKCGSVSAAARSVGMTRRSAYRLIDAPDAASFAAAWDEAVDLGVARLRLGSLERALKGDYVPIYRRGKLVQVEHRRNDRLAIALLSGRDREVDAYRRAAASRHEYSTDMGALDAARAAREAQIHAAENAYEAEVKRLVDGVVDRFDYGRVRGQPSVRSL